MITIEITIDQLKTTKSLKLQPTKKIDHEIRNYLQEIGIDVSDWAGFQYLINYNNEEYTSNKTLSEMGVKNNSKVLINISKAMKIQILNKEFSQSTYSGDAFENINKFKDWFINFHLKKIPFSIEIKDGVNGKSIDKELWIQNTALNSIPVFLCIQVSLTINFLDRQFIQNLNIFDPISKLIKKFQTEIKRNGVLQLSYQDTILKPEKSYFDLNLPPDIKLQASFPAELNYQIIFEKEQVEEKHIVCQQDNMIRNVIKDIRRHFRIDNSSKIELQYQWVLEPLNTFAEEGIPNFSKLNLIESQTNGEIQITLQNLDQSIENAIIQMVKKNTCLKDLASRIPVENNQLISFYSENNQELDSNQNMEDLQICYGDVIQYRIQRNQKIKLRINPIITKTFQILVININTVIQIEYAIENTIAALGKILLEKLCLPKNQQYKFSIGTQLLNDQDVIQKVAGLQNSQNLQVLLLTTLDIYFKDLKTNTQFLTTVNLIDTLRSIAEKYQIADQVFSKNSQNLFLDDTFIDLQISNRDVIEYQQTTPKEKAKNKPEYNIIHQPSPTGSSRSEIKDPQEDLQLVNFQPDQVENQHQYQDQIQGQAIVNVSAGGQIYKFRMQESVKFEQLKIYFFQTIFEGDQQRNKQYSLYYNGIALKDHQTPQSLNLKNIDIQIKLTQNPS